MTRLAMTTVASIAAVLGVAMIIYHWSAGVEYHTEQPIERCIEGERPERILTGIVLGTHGPLPEARVRWQGSGEFVLTDAHGRFSISVPAGLSRILTASAVGHFIGSTHPNATTARIELVPLPSCDTADYSWIDPGPESTSNERCVRCHQEIYDEWNASSHARSATNRRFLSLYNGTDWDKSSTVGWNLKAEYPEGVGVCTACHAPSLSEHDPAWIDLTIAQGVPSQGVHCDYCHKIQSLPVANIGLTHGRFGMQLLRPESGQQVFFGPLDDVIRGKDAFAPFYKDSRYCAACHEGTLFGVRAYTTYTEWLESPAQERGQHCQTCHMAAPANRHNFAPGHGGIERAPETLSNHLFRPADGQLLEHKLHVRVRLARQQQGIHASITLDAAEIGHRVPTGFVDRHLILTAEGQSLDGHATLCSSGPIIPEFAGPSVSGLPGRLFARQLSAFNGERPVPFWRAQPECIDTRIDPRQIEHAKFTFSSGTERVRVRLIYRRFWESVRLAKKWPDETRVLFDKTVSLCD